MLKKLYFVALMCIVTAGVPGVVSATGAQTANVGNAAVAASVKKTVLSSVVRKVDGLNVTVEFYSPSIVRVVKAAADDAGAACINWWRTVNTTFFSVYDSKSVNAMLYGDSNCTSFIALMGFVFAGVPVSICFE